MEFDFSKIQIPLKITKEWILKHVDDYTILYYYYGPFKLNKAYCSFFDKGDSNPSTVFYMGNTGRIIYYDFRSGEKLDCFGFVQKLHGCSFKETLEQIADDFGLIDKSTCKVLPKVIIEAQNEEKQAKKETLIQFEPESWNSKNLEFWRKYEITQNELVRHNVYPVKKLFLNHLEIYGNNTNQYAYPLNFEGGRGVKIYSPNNPKMKWLSSIPIDQPFGINDLCYEDDKVIITKSKKDLIILRKFFKDVVATQNESEASLSEEVQNKLRRRYSQRIIIWDNDDVGVENCKKFNNKGFKYFNIPRAEYEHYRIKDCSDYVEAYGLMALESLLKTKNLL